ncbi:MBG domain-containing protein [Agathobacter sp.]
MIITKSIRKCVSVILTIAMVISFLPMPVVAEESESNSSNYHDTYAILVSVPDAWRNSGGAKIWSSDLGINSDQDLEMVDQNRCLYGLKYTGTLPDSFKMYIKGGNQQAEITTSKEIAQSKYYYIANGGKWITGSEENPNSLPDLSNLNNPQYKIFVSVSSEYANDINLYSWVTGGNGSIGWPGSSMTRLQEDGNGNVLFGGNVNGSNETNIIFNGKSTSGAGWQTNDIYNVSPGENEAVYFKIGMDNGNYSSIERIDFKQVLKSMITLSEYEYTFDNTEKSPEITVKDGNTVLTEGTDYTVSGTTKATKEGEYTVTITGTRKKYIGSVNVTWKIKKNPDTWTYSATGNTITATCNGECGNKGAHTAKLSLNTKTDVSYSGSVYDGVSVVNEITPVTNIEAGDITYVGRNETSYEESTTAPTNAGTYTAKVTIGGATATADFEITKADLSLSLALKNWVYGTAPSTPELGGYNGDGAVSYFYKKQGEADTEYKSITEADFNTISVGKYTLKASVAEGTNYNSAATTCEFAVTKHPITVNVSLDGWTYGDSVKTPSVTVKADENDITSSYESQITYTYYTDSECKNKTTAENGAASDGAVPKNAGTYYVKAEVNASDNYLDGRAVSKFTIAKKTVTATVTAENKIYNGTIDAVVSAVISKDDLISGDSITINGITGTFADKNAGTDKKVTVDSSKAEYTGTGVDNYAITIGKEATASIDKLTAEFNWSNTDLTYTGNEQSITAEVKNAISGDKFTLTYDGNKQTAVGDYTAKVTALGNDNYALPTDNTKAQTAWKISYLVKGTAEVSGTKGDNDWYVTKVTITPEAGYEISANGTDWAASLEYDAQGCQTATYYLKEKATGFITDKKTAEFKIDTGLPTGEIKIKDNGFTEFLNTITFKHFFKKTVDVTITGTDATSGVAKIEYQKVAKGASFDKDGAWTEGKSFSMTANDKSAIYARITDKAGNLAIINSEGIVVYTDATATAEETFTRTSTEDVTTGITVNGNTIASVKNGSDTVAESAYEIKEDKLVLKASYLQTLAAGTYTLTVSYNPYGEAYTADSKGDAPDTSVITLTVKKATGSITDISDISKVYDGTAVNAPTFATTNDRGTDDANVTIEYKKQGAEDSTYTSEAPQDYGKYVVRITVKSDDDYETVVTTKEFSIHKKEMKVSADGYTGTYDGQAYGITVNVTEPADNAASNVKVVYGTKDTDGKITYSENPVTYKDAGEYTVYYKVTADNYEDAEGSAVVKIAPKTVSLVWSDTEFTYDGKAHKPTAKVSEKDIISPDSVEVTVSGEQTKAGSYTAQAVALSNGNYTLGTDVSTAYVIKKAAATVTVDNATKHIGKNDPKFTYKVTGLVEGESLTDISLARTEGETAGDYDITATAKEGSNTNYDVTFVAGKLTIEDHIKAETPVVENRVEATCTEAGSYDEVYYCTVAECKAELERVHKTIPATGHKYGEPEFSWDKDYSTAKAEFTCANDKSHIETVEAKVTSETVEATCETAGKTVYTAKAEFEGKAYTDTKEVEIKAIGHDYANPVFVWSEDYSTAKATFTCTHDASHISEKDCEVTAKTVNATCTTEGTVTYTANVTLAGKIYTDTKVVNNKALGHKYGTPVFNWNDDYSKATAVFTCENDKSHIETVEATVTSETVAATCETAGKTTYTATAEFEGKTYTDSKENVIGATGHDYADPVFTWNADKATATFTCKNDKTHVLVKDCEVTAESVDATCTTAGKVTYTASVIVAGKAYKDTKVVNGTALGHKYGTPIFTWSDDYSTAEATFTCANDKTHVETVKATVTSETVDPTCETAGKITYTATAEFEGKTYTDSKETEIKAKGHNWSDWKVTKEATATENGKKESACTVCGIKRYEVIPATGVPTEDPSNGKLEKDVQVAPTAPVQEATMTNTKSELLEAPNIFKEEEKTLIKEGKVDAKVWMEINETNVESIPQETKDQVEKEAEKIMGDQASDIMYFDADLFKQVSDASTGEAITPKEQIHEPGEHIDVTVKIPEKLLIDETKRSMVREYKIIRIHTDQTTGEDIVDVLDGDFNEETGEFSFATDKFSTYAIAFTDVAIEVSISDNGDSSDITAIGDTKQLTATVTPDSAAKRDVEWTSSDTSVATVDENGVITSVGNGTAVIRATVADSDVYAEYTVKVNVPSKDAPDTPSTPTTPSKPGSTGNPAAPVAKPDTKPVTPKKEEKSSTQKAVKTGDENRTWLFIMMMFAGAGMVVFGRKKKENR